MLKEVAVPWVRFLLLQLIYHITKTYTAMVFAGKLYWEGRFICMMLAETFFSSLPLEKCFVWSMYVVVVRQEDCQPLHTKPYSTLIQRNGPEYTKQSFCLRYQTSQLILAWLIQNQRDRSTAELLVSSSSLVDPHTVSSKAKTSSGHKSQRPYVSCPPSIRV